jgi:ATP-binding cassette subfamily B protein
MNIGITGVVALSASRVANHQADPETVIAFMQYFTQISMAMMVMTRLFVMYSKCTASAKRVEEVLLCEDELAEHPADAYETGDPDQLQGGYRRFF